MDNNSLIEKLTSIQNNLVSNKIIMYHSIHQSSMDLIKTLFPEYEYAANSWLEKDKILIMDKSAFTNEKLFLKI